MDRAWLRLKFYFIFCALISALELLLTTKIGQEIIKTLFYFYF